MSSISASTPLLVDPPQLLIVLAGVVGSGKSTFAHALVNQVPGWARVNQDDLGDRRACEDMVKMYLSQGLSVVLDRQNFDDSQRRTWLEIAVDYPAVTVACMVMSTPPRDCQARLLVRTGHPTIQDPQLATELLAKFIMQWKEPALNEGFDFLMTLPSLPDTPGLTPVFLEFLLYSLLSSQRNPNGARQRADLRRPRYGYNGPPRGGYGYASRGGFSTVGGGGYSSFGGPR